MSALSFGQSAILIIMQMIRSKIVAVLSLAKLFLENVSRFAATDFRLLFRRLVFVGKNVELRSEKGETKSSKKALTAIYLYVAARRLLFG